MQGPRLPDTRGTDPCQYEDVIMGAWLKRLAMSFIVTLGFTAGKLPAQAPLVPYSMPPDPAPLTQMSAIVARPPLPPSAVHPRLNSRGYCCGSDPTWMGCNNVHWQNNFVFGSCRS